MRDGSWEDLGRHVGFLKQLLPSRLPVFLLSRDQTAGGNWV